MTLARTARRRSALFALLPLWMTGAAGIALTPVAPVYAQQGVEKIAKSGVTGIPLKGALRLTGSNELAQLRKQLDTLSTNAGGKRGTDEALIWTSPAYTGLASSGPIMNDVAAQMKSAGYAYQAPEVKTDEGEGAGVIATKGNDTIVGIWLKTEQFLILTWCRVDKAGASASPSASTTTNAPTDLTNTPLPPDNSEILVPGEPALTRQMVEHTCHFLAYLLEAPFTDEQRATVQKSLTEDWQKKDKTTIAFVNDSLHLRAQIFQKSDTERDFIRKQIQPKILHTLRAAKDDAGAKFILAIYNNAHTPLASGNPPLTRQMTDAYTELFFFTASEVIGEKFTPTEADKKSMAKILASGYAKAPAEGKKTLEQMPLLWSALGVAWPHMSEAEKKPYRDRWRQDLQKMLPPAQTASAKSASSSPSKTTSKSSKSSGSSSQSLSQRMAAMQAMQRAYQMQSNIMWQSHYSRMNMIANLGPSPYRYVNSSGVPY